MKKGGVLLNNLEEYLNRQEKLLAKQEKLLAKQEKLLDEVRQVCNRLVKLNLESPSESVVMGELLNEEEELLNDLEK